MLTRARPRPAPSPPLADAPPQAGVDFELKWNAVSLTCRQFIHAPDTRQIVLGCWVALLGGAVRYFILPFGRLRQGIAAAVAGGEEWALLLQRRQQRPPPC